MREAFGFPPAVSGLLQRPHHGGIVIAYVEPIDVMLACTEMTEWAAMSACARMSGAAPLELEPKRTEIDAILARDRSPGLRRLEAEARARDLPFLWDDEEVSVGYGTGSSATWPRHAVPDVAEVPWDRLGRVPIALVTGTNGKTTSTRWLARVAMEAGRTVGVTSSDAIAIGGQVISAGDWTGPQAARVVLRRTDVDLAVLETARGGILRRGLAIDRCDVALMTNISDDHLGSYGIDDLDAMTNVKAVIAEAAKAVVLNAADPRLAALAKRFADRRVLLYADLDTAPEARAVVEGHRGHRGESVVAENGRIRRGEIELGQVDEIPLTFRGAARFNVANALGVAAAATALGLPDDAIRRALTGFTTAENPRRTALAEKNGVRVLLDFGHNPDGIRAVMGLVRQLRGAGRLFVCLGSAGDRTDHELDEMARHVVEAQPRSVILREMPDYLRGRALGDVTAFFRGAFARRGFTELRAADSEVDSLRVALSEAEPGDFVILLVHLDHDAVAAYIAS
ncbi:MAG: Mur ligase family protein [Labilithrix sp.]